MQTSNRSNSESTSSKVTGWFIKLFILAVVMTPVLIIHLVTGAGFWLSLFGALLAMAFLGCVILFISGAGK